MLEPLEKLRVTLSFTHNYEEARSIFCEKIAHYIVKVVIHARHFWVSEALVVAFMSEAV